MERSAPVARLPAAATGTMIRLATSRPSARLAYSLPIVLVTASLAVALLLRSAQDGLFSFMLLVVLVVALALGLGPALVTVAISVAAGVVVEQLVEPGGSLLPAPNAGVFAAEAATVAFIGGVARATIGVALRLPRQAAPGPVSPNEAPAGLIEPLTPRELEVLRAAASGRSPADLADELCVSVNTIKTHLAHCYDKLGAHNRAEAIARGLRCGCLDGSDLELTAANHPQG